MEDTYNLVGGNHAIDNDLWAVSLVRKKNGKGAEHGFLLIEGFQNNEYKIIRADLFINEDYPLGSSAISGQSGLEASNKSGNVSAKALPASSGKCVLFASNASGKAEIHMKELLVNDLKELAGQCEYQTFGISKDNAQKLLTAIAKDIGADIGYNLYGDGSSYSISFLSKKYHSCVSWAMEKLDDIGTKVTGTWHDFIIIITSKILPGAEQPEEERTTGCNLM